MEVTPAKAEVYWEDLCDLPDEQFVVACARARREWDKPYTLPPIAVLLRYAEEAAEAAGAIVTGEQAWAAFLARVVRRYSFGVTKAHDWPDELTRDIVRNHLGLPSGGVYDLARIENEYELDHYRKLFVAEYTKRRGTAAAVQAAAPRLVALESRTRTGA